MLVVIINVDELNTKVEFDPKGDPDPEMIVCFCVPDDHPTFTRQFFEQHHTRLSSDYTMCISNIETNYEIIHVAQNHEHYGISPAEVRELTSYCCHPILETSVPSGWQSNYQLLEETVIWTEQYINKKR